MKLFLLRVGFLTYSNLSEMLLALGQSEGVWLIAKELLKESYSNQHQESSTLQRVEGV